MTGYDYDLFVIGAGSGGVRAARVAAGHGARVAIAEEWRIGGTCVLRGCVPKKLLVYASRFADAFEDAVGYGWTIEGASFSWPDLVAAKNREIQRLSEIYERNLLASTVAIHKSRAVVEGPHTLALANGKRVTAETVLVSTGAWPFRLNIPGAQLALTSNEVFDLPQLPETMLIVGAGYIAVEFAGLLQRLGCKVTLAHRGPKLLRGFDEDLREAAAEALRAAGVKLLLETEIFELRRGKDESVVVTFHDHGLANFGAVMLASGRIPNAQGLGLEGQGVLFDPIGAIRVDSFSQTTAPWIYAVGDVTNRLNLTPVAIREGHAVADTLYGGRPTTMDHRNVPTAVFLTPEIGTVGLSEAEARARHPEIDIYKTRFRPMKATLSGRADRTLMKLVVEPKSDRVLGVHIVGEDAAEMAQLAGIAVKFGATKEDFDATVAVHPTAAEELVTMRTAFVPPPAVVPAPLIEEPPAVLAEAATIETMPVEVGMIMELAPEPSAPAEPEGEPVGEAAEEAEPEGEPEEEPPPPIEQAPSLEDIVAEIESEIAETAPDEAPPPAEEKLPPLG